MTGSPATNEAAKALMVPPVMVASGSGGSGYASSPPTMAAGSRDHMAEMMGCLQLTAAEAAAVVLDDEDDDFQVHSEWTLVGKVMSPSNLHISTISSALRPAWGNPHGLVLNPAGDNLFVAEFGSKADKHRVLNGPPWVVGKHTVLFQEFNVDLHLKDMNFNNLRV
jgi:DNA-binding beta-propeller fold protein YncE